VNASLREIVLAVRYGDASLVGESVGYLILGACDRAVAVARSADLDGVLVTGEGDVVLDATPASEDEAERSLRLLLGQLLTLLRAPFPNLARVAVREPCGLRHLVTELEAALVPVNRRAARRSLSRLVRETRRSLTKEHQHVAVADVLPSPDPGLSLFAQPVPSPVPAQAWSEPEPAWPEPDIDVGWVDEVPSLVAEPVTQALERRPSMPESADTPATRNEAAGFDDEFDDALTRVATAVETLPPPEIQRRSTFNLRRLVTTAELEGPLLPTLASAVTRPSSIQELLHHMHLEGEPTEVVLAGLALLARVDVSPAAPPVG
jgi:hypothetical protein